MSITIIDDPVNPNSFQVVNEPTGSYQECLNALRLALPCLIRLGDFIGNGEGNSPMGRCEAVLAVKNAIARIERGRP